MRRAAVTHLQRDLVEVQFIVFQQFFYPFDLLVDYILFNGDLFCFGEKAAQLRIILIETRGDII